MTGISRSLMGMVDPSGLSLGFQVPLFTGGNSNAPLVQRISNAGTIEQFEPYEAPDAPILRAPERQVYTDTPAVHAFAFGKDDVVIVQGESGRDELLARIDDPVLKARPMLAMELADFLGEQDLRCDLALKAHARLRKGSVETADQWLDLSVLTPDIRRILARSGGRTSSMLATMVVARTRRGVIEILGLSEELSQGQYSELRSAAMDAVAGLVRLYPLPPGGWSVQVRKPASPSRHHQAQAAVLLASDKARELLRAAPWVLPPDLDIHIEDGIAFTRVVKETETPLFVVYDAANPEVMHRAMGDWTVRDMHGIALDTARSRPWRSCDARQLWNSTQVQAAGLGGGRRSDVAGVRLAIAAELDRKAQDLSLHSGAAALLRARGVGPDPKADAWAALYDRAWGMGLAPWQATLIPGAGRETRPSRSYSADYSYSYDAGLEPEWAAQALFHEARYLDGSVTSALMAELRNTAALLVSMEPREEPDLGRHRSSITRLLERQRWSIVGDDFRSADALLVARGGQAEFQLMVRPNGVQQPEWKRLSLFEIDLLAVDRLLVSGPAAPGAVLSHLAGTGELMVGMRDLTSIDAADATPLTLVAAQLRRMVTGLPSSARTHFIALVAMQAVRGGRMDESARALLRLIQHPGLGRDLHLTVSSINANDGELAARIRVVSGQRGEGRRLNEASSFVMAVSSRFVTITSNDRGSAQDDDVC